jgi:hypothetical protein
MGRANIRTLFIALGIAAATATSALAKLPPLSDDAKAKAAETAAKTAWSDKVGAYQLCQSMNRVAEQYRKTAKAEGKTTPAPVDTPACTDPGPYVAPAAAGGPKPLEAAGAHSPPGPATTPPSSNATHSEINGPAKK